MHLILADTAVDATLIGTILQSAGTGTAIIVVLILIGAIAPRSYVTRVEADADRWHAAYEAKDREAGELRAALAVQTERADAAVQAAQRSADILERLQPRRPP